MSFQFAAMRRSVSCAGRLFVRAVVSSLPLSPWIPTFAQDAQQAPSTQPVELPAIYCHRRAAGSKPTNQGVEQFGRRQSDDHPHTHRTVGKFVTVITADDIQSQQISNRARRAGGGAGTQYRPDRRSGRPDIGLHSRHQLQSRQSSDRQRRRVGPQQSQPILRFRPAVNGRHRSVLKSCAALKAASTAQTRSAA